MKARTAQICSSESASPKAGMPLLNSAGAMAAPPPLGVAEEQFVAVVPGVAVVIMRRRRQRAVGLGRPPVGFALQAFAVALGAMLGINRAAEGHHLGVGGVGARRAGPEQKRIAGYRRKAGPDGHEEEDAAFRQGAFSRSSARLRAPRPSEVHVGTARPRAKAGLPVQVVHSWTTPLDAAPPPAYIRLVRVPLPATRPFP